MLICVNSYALAISNGNHSVTLLYRLHSNILVKIKVSLLERMRLTWKKKYLPVLDFGNNTRLEIAERHQWLFDSCCYFGCSGGWSLICFCVSLPVCFFPLRISNDSFCTSLLIHNTSTCSPYLTTESCRTAAERQFRFAGWCCSGWRRKTEGIERQRKKRVGLERDICFTSIGSFQWRCPGGSHKAWSGSESPVKHRKQKLDLFGRDCKDKSIKNKI